MTAPFDAAVDAIPRPVPDQPLEDQAARTAQIYRLVRDGFHTALGLDDIADDADFFDLGGDSLMALSLLLHIEQQLGVTLPISALYDATSIVTLTARLVQGFSADADRTLIELRPAQAPHPGPPLFLLHGLGGSVMVLRDLARSMTGRRAVLGIEAQGLSGEAPPQDSVDEMAAHALARMRGIAPHGPYFLAGYSFGGLIALEIARRLRAAGEEVGLLALLDTFPHPRFWPRAARARAFLRQFGVYVSLTTWSRLWRREREALRGQSLPAVARRLARGAIRVLTLPLDVMGTAWVYDVAGRAPRPAEMLAPVDPSAMTATNYETIEAVTDAAKRAFAAYKPRSYDGDMLILHATEQQIVPFDPRAVWRDVARRLTVIDLPTDHQALVRGHARATAAELSRAIAAHAAKAAP